MFYKLLCASIVACVFAAPPPTNVVPLESQQPTVIPIVSQSEELEPNGTYKFSYETANGIKREETSYDKLVPKIEGRSGGSSEGGSDESDEIHVQQGSYSYTAPDGTIITLRYIADENGFQPIGDHLPKAPVLQQQVQARTSNVKSGRALSTDNSSLGSSPEISIANTTASLAAPIKLEARSGIEPEVSSVKTAQDSISEKTTTAATTSGINQSTTDAASSVSVEESTTGASSTTVADSSSEVHSTTASEPSTAEHLSSTESASTVSEVSMTESASISTVSS